MAFDKRHSKTLYNTGELSRNRLGTNVLLVLSSNLNLKFGDFALLFCGALKETHGNYCCTIIFLFLTKILSLWRCCCRSRRLALNSLKVSERRRRLKFKIGGKSTGERSAQLSVYAVTRDVFGSELFSLLTCLLGATFILISIFSSLGFL